METTKSPVLEKPTAAMVSASTEISAEASAKIDALARKDDRSRAYILRQAIHEFTDKLPAAKKAKA